MFENGDLDIKEGIKQGQSQCQSFKYTSWKRKNLVLKLWYWDIWKTEGAEFVLRRTNVNKRPKWHMRTQAFNVCGYARKGFRWTYKTLTRTSMLGSRSNVVVVRKTANGVVVWEVSDGRRRSAPYEGRHPGNLLHQISRFTTSTDMTSSIHSRECLICRDISTLNI